MKVNTYACFMKNTHFISSDCHLLIGHIFMIWDDGGEGSGYSREFKAVWTRKRIAWV